MVATNSASLNILVNASGAFFGALFAFLFGLMTYYWTKWVERQKKDYDAMVKLEGSLNEHLNTTSRNQYLIHGSIDTLNKGFMTYNLLRSYRITEDLELFFLDIDLINSYFAYKDSISSLNHDFDAANRANDILREVVLSGKHNDITIKANSQNLSQNLQAINKMVATIDDETKALLCLIRLKLKHDKPGLVGLNRLFKQPYHPSKSEIDKEMQKLNKEIDETKEESAKLILKSLEK